MNSQGWISSDCKKGWVSVIIPTYNRAAYLQGALQSVAEQTYRPIECVVVDDGSTDQTETVLEQFKRQQNETFTLLVIKQENAGAQVARNGGTAVSKGEFIQYLDSDDILYPDKISKQVAFLQERQDCDCVFGDWDKGRLEQSESVIAYKAEDFISQIFTIERPIANFSFLMRRSLASKASPWDVYLKRMQEIDFQLNALMAGGNFCYHKQVCGLWCHHTDERIHNMTTVLDMIPFFRKWETILKKNNLFTAEMAEKVAKWYMWLVSQSKQQKLQVLLPVLQEVVRLQPSISFYEKKRMKMLRHYFGEKQALAIWLFRYCHMKQGLFSKKHF